MDGQSDQDKREAGHVTEPSITKRGRGRPKGSGKAKPIKSSKGQNPRKKDKKGSKSDEPLYEEPTEVKVQEEKDDPVEGKDQCDEGSNQTTGKECNQVKYETQNIRKRVIGRREYQTALKYLNKKLLKSKTEREVKQYEYMLYKMQYSCLVF